MLELEYGMENWFYIPFKLYNQALKERKKVWKAEKKTIICSHQQNSLPKLKEREPSGNVNILRRKHFLDKAGIPFCKVVEVH